MHGGTKGLLESGSKLKPGSASALVEAVSKCDLLIVASRQEPYLVSEEIGREIKSDLCSDVSAPAPEWGSLLCGVVLPMHVRCKPHERILIQKHQRFVSRGNQLGKPPLVESVEK